MGSLVAVLLQSHPTVTMNALHAVLGLCLLALGSAQQWGSSWNSGMNGFGGNWNGMNGMNSWNGNMNNGMSGFGMNMNMGGNMFGCTPQERNYLFNRCMSPWAMAHRQYWPQWRQNGICPMNTINCGVTYQFLRCMNNIPRSMVSDQCFSQTQNLADWYWRNSGINCPFSQIRAKCQSGISPFVNPMNRPQSGFGMNNFGFNG